MRVLLARYRSAVDAHSYNICGMRDTLSLCSINTKVKAAFGAARIYHGETVQHIVTQQCVRVSLNIDRRLLTRNIRNSARNTNCLSPERDNFLRGERGRGNVGAADRVCTAILSTY